ncbi:MAG: radical SAM protein, partial [candidate division WOR-3 bacterium]
MIFFEQLIPRRQFLKDLGIIALGGIFAREILKALGAENLKTKPGYFKLTPALHYKKLSGNKIRCLLCPRECVVSKGNKGFCRARKNVDGYYYTLVHSNPC